MRQELIFLTQQEKATVAPKSLKVSLRFQLLVRYGFGKSTRWLEEALGSCGVPELGQSMAVLNREQYYQNLIPCDSGHILLP